MYLSLLFYITRHVKKFVLITKIFVCPVILIGTKFGFNEGISLTEWRTRYKTEFQEALQQMNEQCNTLRHQCSDLKDKLSNSNGIVSLHRRSGQTTPLLNGEVKPWKTQQ